MLKSFLLPTTFLLPHTLLLQSESSSQPYTPGSSLYFYLLPLLILPCPILLNLVRLSYRPNLPQTSNSFSPPSILSSGLLQRSTVHPLHSSPNWSLDFSSCYPKGHTSLPVSNLDYVVTWRHRFSIQHFWPTSFSYKLIPQTSVSLGFQGVILPVPNLNQQLSRQFTDIPHTAMSIQIPLVSHMPEPHRNSSIHSSSSALL